tara:strand:+ start:928 stop:1341 length:414 start_codon:yes stop_codon:yes gene_type:complete
VVVRRGTVPGGEEGVGRRVYRNKCFGFDECCVVVWVVRHGTGDTGAEVVSNVVDTVTASKGVDILTTLTADPSITTWLNYEFNILKCDIGYVFNDLAFVPDTETFFSNVPIDFDFHGVCSLVKTESSGMVGSDDCMM